MTNRNSGNIFSVDLLIDELVKKLTAHRSVIEKSHSYGRVIRRSNPKNAMFDIELEVKL